MQYVAERLNSNPALMDYDPLQDAFWKRAEPKFLKSLEDLLIGIVREDFQTVESKHHVLQAIKYLGCEGMDKQKRAEIYDSIEPFKGAFLTPKEQGIWKTIASLLFGSSYEVWDDNPLTNGDETQKDDGFDLGIALEYIFNPKWKVSVGYMYTDTGIDPDNMSIEAPELNANTLAGGFAFSPTQSWDFNFGILKTFYEDETTSSGILLEKDVILLGFGVQYKFL